MDPTLPIDAFGSVSAPVTPPIDSTTTNPAIAPTPGPGWQQTAKDLGGVFNNTLGTLRANNGQLTSQQQGQPGQPGQGAPKLPTTPGGPASGQPTLSQQAQALLQRGIINQEQYQKVMAAIGGTVPSTGMPEMIASQSTPQGQPAPMTAPMMNPVNGPSPISPAWGS